MRATQETNSDTEEHSSHLHSSSPPPGFLQERGSGALSAPPPPGFNSGQFPVRTVNPNAWSGNDSRTMSFTNLAAVIGTGLAESMDASTKDAYRDSLFGQDLNYARQSRHAASRMIGNNNGGAYPGGNLLSQLTNLSPTKKSNKVQLNSLSLNSFRMDHNADELYPIDNDPLADFKASMSYGNSMFPTPKDVGLTVMEPVEMGRSSAPPMRSFGDLSSSSRGETPVMPSRGGTPDLTDLRRSMDHVSFESNPQQRSLEAIHAEVDLAPFVWDVRATEPSRSLVILRATTHPDIRTTCEAFGVLENFRADFGDKGVIFVGFYDIRSAQYAAMELNGCLRRMKGGRNTDMIIKYCVPLNASSAQDESLILLSDLPTHTKEEWLMQSLSSYGSIRSLTRQGSRYGNASLSYAVEFHSMQDAKQAFLELERTQPWGPDVLLEVGTRSASERKKGRELLALIGRWRQDGTLCQGGRPPNTSNGQRTPPRGETSPGPPTQYFDGTPFRPNMNTACRNPPRSQSPMVSAPDIYTSINYPSSKSDSSEGNNSCSNSQHNSQLVVGPDGRYSYVMVNQSAYPLGHHLSSAHHTDTYGTMHGISAAPPPQHIIHGPHGSYLAPAVHVAHTSQYTIQSSHGRHMQYLPHRVPPSHHPHQYHPPPNADNTARAFHGENHLYDGVDVSSTAGPHLVNVFHPNVNSIVSSDGSSTALSGSQLARGAVMNDKDTRHLTLIIDAVRSGEDSRTSLMVRNIPNKYTQQMLLSEFAESGHGPGKIDFFYLPIDFKNKCNRGYAFINFVDFRDIIPFHQQYFCQHWRVFNSDKICDITYARIQGKSGMLKRFENSALMEKDEEYKPLVFASHGQEKGKRLPFPSTDASA